MSSVSPSVSAPHAPESFAALFEESLTRKEMRVGEVITAEIVSVDDNFVIVNAGLKSESIIPVEEFRNDAGGLDIKPGDFVSVSIEALEDGYGATRLSRDKAKRLAAWLDLEKGARDRRKDRGHDHRQGEGRPHRDGQGHPRVPAGLARRPAPVKDTTPYEAKQMQFKVIKLDRKRNNVVVSRRAVLEETAGAEREALLATLQEGAVVKGVVKNITDYGAFVDLGGIDGLLHITDLAWRRVKHPSEVVNVGDEVTAKVLKFDTEKNRVSLGLKQLGEDPWVGIGRRYPQGTRLFGKVTNLTDYGAFVEVEAGNRRLGPRVRDGLDQQERASVEGRAGRRRGRGDDPRDRRRAPAHLARHEAMHAQPVGRLRARVQEGRSRQGHDQVDHRFRRVRRPAGRHRRAGAPFGPVLERSRRGGRAQVQEGRRARGGGPVDRRRARAHLARRQADGRRPVHELHRQPRQEQRGAGRGEVGRCEGRGHRADPEVEGYLRASEFSRERVEDLRTELKEGDAVQAMIINVDRKNRSINLSVKAKDLARRPRR
jgi:small subunit ribosomal protein S1